MEHNPYAPPKAAVADRVPTGLKRRSVLLMIIFTIVSFGLYIPIWFFRRRAALNGLNSPRKVLLNPLVLFTSVNVINLIVAIAASPGTPEEMIGPIARILDLIQLVAGVLMLWQCFVIKDILQDHLTPVHENGVPLFASERVTLSGILTFFFSIFYLQHIINRDIVGSGERVA
jgi:hypothetical protein